MNWTAGIAIAAGGILLIIGWRNTHDQLWTGLGGTVASSSSNGAGGTFSANANTTGQYQTLAMQDAAQYGINPITFVNQIQAESGFNPNAHSSAGAVGIAQFMPSTAASLGVNPNDPTASLKAAAKLMSQYLTSYGGNQDQALAAYNAGPGTVNQALTHGASWMDFIPAETRAYITKITGGRAV